MAILGAPGFLSGLTDTELTFVKQNVEQHMAPEVTKARDATLKAMKEARQAAKTRSIRSVSVPVCRKLLMAPGVILRIRKH